MIIIIIILVASSTTMCDESYNELQQGGVRPIEKTVFFFQYFELFIQSDGTIVIRKALGRKRLYVKYIEKKQTQIILFLSRGWSSTT